MGKIPKKKVKNQKNWKFEEKRGKKFLWKKSVWHGFIYAIFKTLTHLQWLILVGVLLFCDKALGKYTYVLMEALAARKSLGF